MKVEQDSSPTPKLGRWERFRIFLRNPGTGLFMGRTGASWAKILLCCAVLCAVLCAFCGTMVAVFYKTQLEFSNSGLGFEPMPTQGNLIWYKASNPGNYLSWTKKLDAFLSDYRNTPTKDGVADTRMSCNYDKPPLPGKVCIPDIDSWRPCIHSNSYNYQKSAPCVFLKFDKILGWNPEFYNDTSKLPSDMPDDLKSHIANEQLHTGRTNTVWVSCEGENLADVEHIGAIQYIPQRGFPGYYFPGTNTPGYLSPLVAVFFEKPKRGVIINIKCTAWARDIQDDDSFGSVHFELMVD